MQQNLRIFTRNFIIPTFLIIIFVITIYILAYPLNITFLKNFITSALFIPLVTLVVGSTAIIIYSKTKDDFKKDAANIVLLEIQNAERALKQVTESVNAEFPTLPQNIFLMQTESWSKYRYLFVRDFDWNEWNEVTDFYDKAQLYDKAVTYNNSFFQKNEEQIRYNIQRTLSDYAMDYTNKVSALKDKDAIEKQQKAYIAKIKQYIDRYMAKDSIYLYAPNKPIADAKLILTIMNKNISLSTIGIKLKELAGIKY